MKPPRRSDEWAWLWLLPVLLLIVVFEYGVIDGFWRFVGFVYVGSFVLLVALLVAALLDGVLLKHQIASYGVVVSLCSLFELIQGNGEKVLDAAVFGVFVGAVLGVAMALVSSSTAEKIRGTENTFYEKLKRWLLGRE